MNVSAGLIVVAVGWAIALIYMDVRYRRLPDWLTLPGGIVILPWLSLTGLAWPALYLVVAAMGAARGRPGLGGGDVKLALPLGVAVSQAAGWWGVLVAVAAANLLTVAQALTWRDGRRPPHGPGMLLAAGGVCLINWL